MNCIDFESVVQELLDARQTELPPDLQTHCDQCADCREFYAGQLLVISACEAWRSPAIPEEMLANVLNELSVVSRVSPERRLTATPSIARGRIVGMVCSAAAMFVLALVLLRSPAGPQPTVTQDTATPPPVETELVSETLSELFQGMSTDYTDLTLGTRQAFKNIRELPHSASLLQQTPPADAEKVERAMEWQRWDRPVSDRVGRAFHFLWDALPQPPPQSS